MASEASPPRYRQLDDGRNSNGVLHRRHGSSSTSPPPFRGPRSDRDFQRAPLEVYPRSDTYRRSSHSYKASFDSYRPSHNRKLTGDTYRPPGNLERTMQGDTSPLNFRSTSSPNSAELHHEPERIFPYSLNRWQTDGTGREPGLVPNIDASIPTKSSTHHGKDTFDYSKVPKGPKGNAMMNPTGQTPKLLSGLARKPRASRDWRPLGVEFEEGSEPSEASKRFPNIFVTLHDSNLSKSVFWTIALLENFHNYLMSPRTRVGLVTKYFLSSKRVFVFAEVQVLAKVVLACRKEKLFNQYQMESSSPDDFNTDANLSHSWEYAKTHNSVLALPSTPPHALEEQEPQHSPREPPFLSPGLPSGGAVPQCVSTTPPYSPPRALLDKATIPVTVREIPPIVPTVDVTHADSPSNHDAYPPSPTNAASEISSIRSVSSLKEHQCARCKGAASGIDPIVRCSRCKRRYHDSCRNLMKGSSGEG
jgi:hypothetical protein